MNYKGRTVSYEFLGTTASGKKMSPVLATIHARAIEGPENFAKHDGEEFVYVLRGEIDVHFDTGELIQLSRGDSLYFDSRIGHAYVSTSRQLAKVIAVLTEEIAHPHREFAP
ncbi:Cupin domain protein [compost metagenome]